MDNNLFQDKFAISTKEKKALDAFKIATIEDFLNFDIERVRALKGFGQTTIDKLLRRRQKFSARQIKHPEGNITIENGHFAEFDSIVSSLNYSAFTHQPWQSSCCGATDKMNRVFRLLNAPAQYPANSILALPLSSLIELAHPNPDDFLTKLFSVKLAELIDEADTKYLSKLNPAAAGDNVHEVLACTLGKLLQVIPDPDIFDRIINSILRRLDIDLENNCILAKLEGILYPGNFGIELSKIWEFFVDFLNKLPITPPFISANITSELNTHFGITTYGDLAILTEQVIISKNGLKHQTLIGIKCIWSALTTLKNSKTGIFSSFPSFNYHFATVQDIYAYLLKDLVKKPKQLTMVVLRHTYVENGHVNTYEEIGRICHCSRERVRQINSKYDALLQNSSIKIKLFPFWVTAHSILYNAGGILDSETFSLQLSNAIFNGHICPTKNLIELLSLTSAYVFYDKDAFVGLRLYPCCKCPVLRTHTMKALSSVNKFEALAAISDTISVLCPSKCTNQRKLRVHPKYIEETIRSSDVLSPNWKVFENWVMSNDIYQICNSNLEDGLVMFMRLFGKPLHIADVPKQFQSYLPIAKKLTRQRAHIILMSSPDILMWGRGTYVHKTNVAIDIDSIKTNDFINNQLNSKSFLTAYELYNFYKQATVNPTIPNEQALYDAFRAQIGNQFHLPRFPYIYKDADSSDSKIMQLVETFVEDRDTPTTYCELDKFIKSNGNFRYPLTIIQGIPTLIKVDESLYSHVNNINIHSKYINNILDYIVEETKKYPSISVEKVFYTKLVTCHEAGINNPIMLYSIISSGGSFDLDFPRYPTIVSAQINENGTTVRNFTEAIISFIEKAKRPISFEELSEEFNKKRGYKCNSFYNLISNRGTELGLLQCAKSFLISKELIDWNRQKQETLIEIANDYFKMNCSTKQPFGTVSALIEEANLPDLSNCVYWSESLLADLLEMSSEFYILGNKKNAYLPKNNNLGIASFGDLVHIALQNNFNGIATFADLSIFLKDMEVVIKSVTPSMLAGFDTIKHNSSVVYTIEMEQYVKGS